MDSGLPISFEHFVQREQELLQKNDGTAVVVSNSKKIAAASKPIPGEKGTKPAAKRPKKKAKTSSVYDDIVFATVKKEEPTEAEVNAAMATENVPTGNSKEDRKKRRLIRNRVSAQLHRERKKKYISSLENKVKEQVEQLQRMRVVIDSLTRENQKLLQISAKNQCASCASSGSDSSLPYSPSMSEGTDDDVEEEKDEVLTFPKGMALKRNPSMESVEDMGDVMDYADTLFDGVDLTDEGTAVPDFDLGLWPEVGDIDGLGTPTGAKQNKRKFAFLFGVFFMTALFGTSFMQSSSHPVLMIDQARVPPVAEPNHAVSPSSRRRRLLSIPPQTRPSPVQENGGNGRKLFALWQKIMQDAKPLRNGTCSPQDVKQLVYHLENISSKVEPRPAVGMSSAPRLRATLAAEKADTSMVAYNHGANIRRINLPEQAGNNGSFLLCPKPYGSMAHQPKGAAQHEEMDVLMFDDVKVNRDLVLFMPSTSVGVKQAPGSSWDGQWVQVNAVVKNIRAAHGFESASAIASL